MSHDIFCIRKYLDFGIRKIKAECYSWFSWVDFLYCYVSKDMLSLCDSILLYLYVKNVNQFHRIRILCSLLFVTDSHEQHKKNVFFLSKRSTSAILLD
jgi:hypothetical protein